MLLHIDVIFVYEPVQYNDYSVSTVDTDGVKHPGHYISSYSAWYTPIRCQLFMG